MGTITAKTEDRRAAVQAALDVWNDTAGQIGPDGYVIKVTASHHACPDPAKCEYESRVGYDRGIAFRTHWIRKPARS